MGQTKIKLFIISLFSFILMVPYSFTYAGTLDLTQACTQDADCVSTKCGQSTLTGAQTKFCVCSNETQCETKFKKDTGETWTCNPGEAKTKGLAYCLSSTKGIQDPAPSGGTTPTPEAAATAPTAPIKLTKPVLSIPIPSMPSFADIEVAPGQKASIPYIAQYVSGIYKYGLTLASILAVMMIVAGGVMYLISSADPSKVATAKQMIFGSITGLTVLLCSYLLLQIINPNLVNPEAIEVDTVKEVQLELPLDYPEASPEELGEVKTYAAGDVTPWKPKGPLEAWFKGVTNMTYTPVKDQKCLKDNFFGGHLEIGDKVTQYITTKALLKVNEFPQRSTQNIPVLATGGYLKTVINATKSAQKGGLGYRAQTHKGAVAGWDKVAADLLASSDAEVKGYMQYFYDRAAGKAPALNGTFEPDVVSTNIGCGAGLKRKECKGGNPGRMDNPFADPHVVGLAVDIMTLSNWDIIVPGSKSKRTINSHSYCKSYQKTVEKLKNGGFGDFFKSDPYKMYPRLDKKIADCLGNKYSIWSVPDEWINIFTKNSFYFAGWAWGDPKRADGMHHEFYGNCFKLKGRQVE